MIKRILFGVATLSAMVAAILAAVAAAAFALYAGLATALPPAAAAAVTALAFAILAGLVALFFEYRTGGTRRTREEPPSLIERLTGVARERPLLTAGGAIAAGLIALKNPQVVASIVSAVLAARTAEKVDRSRR